MRGDAAVKEYTAKFDRVELSSVCVPIDVRTSLALSFVWRSIAALLLGTKLLFLRPIP